VYSVEFPVVDFLFLLSNIASQALGRGCFFFSFRSLARIPLPVVAESV
jgi:hypothetical protein